MGKIHTIQGQSVLLISGDKGFAIYDRDFKCIFETTINKENFGELVFADKVDDKLTIVYGNKSKKILGINLTE